MGSRRGRNSYSFDEPITQGWRQESAGGRSGFSNANERSVQAVHHIDFSDDKSEDELCPHLD